VMRLKGQMMARADKAQAYKEIGVCL
jgi:hypothetical protein